MANSANSTKDSVLMHYENYTLDAMVRRVRDLTARNYHSEAREHAAAWLFRLYESRENANGNAFWATHEALRHVRHLHEWEGSISPTLLRLRETLWDATVRAAEDMGEPYATAAHELNKAM